MSAHSWAGQVSVLWLGTVLAMGGCAKPLRPTPTPPGAVPFVGCWQLEMAAPLTEFDMSERLTVRFDTTVIIRGGAEVGLRAVPLSGFRGDRLVWWVRTGTDTLYLATQSPDGVSWVLVPSGDSLVGETRVFYHFGPTPTEKVVGYARSHRIECDR
jgi:hypothetical protein